MDGIFLALLEALIFSFLLSSVLNLLCSLLACLLLGDGDSPFQPFLPEFRTLFVLAGVTVLTLHVCSLMPGSRLPILGYSY